MVDVGLCAFTELVGAGGRVQFEYCYETVVLIYCVLDFVNVISFQQAVCKRFRTRLSLFSEQLLRKIQ
jgi:hypothetical protein